MRRYARQLQLTICAVIFMSFFGACKAKVEPLPAKLFAPSGKGYAEKADFARLEHEKPLTAADRMTLTPENIKIATQEQVDQIYARLTAGPIPDGSYDGQMFFPVGNSSNTRLAEIVGGGFKGALVNFKVAKIETLGEIAWKGKVFYKNERVLRNRIEDLAIFKPLLGQDVGSIQKQKVDGKETWLLFPAKLYCGQSLLDGRRESVIIDYAFTDDVPGYREKPDALVGRDGLAVRDEIRMVRPGFYLGRAYMKKAFILNFMLYNKGVAEKGQAAFKAGGTVEEDCYVGLQHTTALAHKG